MFYLVRVLEMISGNIEFESYNKMCKYEYIFEIKSNIKNSIDTALVFEDSPAHEYRVPLIPCILLIISESS